MRIELRPSFRATLARVQPGAITRRENAWVLALVVVVTAGGWLRLSGANWDQGAHLHPDERYISSLANLIHFPSSPLTYFEVGRSPLSPYNDTGDHSYSYGTLPLFGTKAVADVLGQGDYDHLYLAGRRLSALLDCATTVLVFLLARVLLAGAGVQRARRGGLLAAALYATTVAAVQAAHFFTTDTWLVFFGTLTFYLSMQAVSTAGRSGRGAILLIALIGVGTGLSIACKASGLFVAVPVLVALLGKAAVAAQPRRVRTAALLLLRDGLLAVVCAYLAFRLVSPYSFEHSNWFDLSLGSDYRHALATQRAILDGKAVFPPTLQWLVSPRLTDPFKNLVIWQLGIPLGVSAVAGTALLAGQVVRRALAAARARAPVGDGTVVALTLQLMVLAYVCSVFLYVATRFQHMGRYLLPIIPLLAVAAAYAVVFLLGRRERLFIFAAVGLIATTGAYALAFHAIYTSTTTRLAANDWIATHIPIGSTIANENWDDTLPIGSGLAVRYTQLIVPVFDPDDTTKVRKLYKSLSRADYYALSSQRAWRTIGRLPDRYPLMVRFYRELFGGRLGFQLAASFSSEPRLFGIHLNDLGAEEAFSVYDHPFVKIFRHRRRLTFSEFRRVLCAPPSPSPCVHGTSR